jgi:hypothetical protein
MSRHASHQRLTVKSSVPSLKRRLRETKQLKFEALEDRHLLATITVTSLTDNGSGGTTLREAVTSANSGDTIVFAASLFSSGPATIQLSSTDTGHLRLEVDNLTIQGPGADLLTIRAHDPTPASDNGDGRRIFNIGDGNGSNFIDVTISGLTLAGGDPNLGDPDTGSGGAIRNMENLTVLNCVFTDNFTFGGGAISNALTTSGGGAGALIVTDSTFIGNRAQDGGAIIVESGSATITRTRFEDNIAENSGGAIISRNCPLTITDSTITGNQAGNPDPLYFSGVGGGVALYGTSSSHHLSITGSTIDGNTAGYQGGGIFNSGGRLTITNSTVSGNTADGTNNRPGGGGIYSDTGQSVTISHSTVTGNTVDVASRGGGIASPGNVALNHTIVAGNFRGETTPDDVSTEDSTVSGNPGSFAATFSLIGDKGNANVTNVNGSLIGTTAMPINALLGPLANNGGPTLTHTLLSGSPAIDAGNPSAVAGAGGVPLFDQRGTPFARIVDGDNAGGSRIDIGAFELVFVNNRPTNPGAVALPAINEDTPSASIAGVLVSTIVTASGSTDPDGNTLGIAVTAAGNANGQWEYSTNAGANWLALTSVSAASARLLAPAHLIRFVPNSNFNSQIGPTPSIDFKAWDQTSGTAGSTGDTTSGNAYSLSAAQATQSVTAVNDAPSFTLSATSVQRNEDEGAVTVNGFATNIAPGPAAATDEASQTLTFLLSITGTTGSIAFTAGPAIDPITGALTFTLASNTSGTATIDAVLQDNGSGTLPDINSSTAQTFTIEVAPVNDEQVLATNTGLTLARSSSGTVAASLLETTDIDDTPADLVYTVTSVPMHGTLLVNGTPDTQFTQQQLNAGVVTYQHDGTATLADSFGFTVDDGEGAASSGTFQISIQPFLGDYNGDSSVNAADYVAWRKFFNTTGVTPYSGADGDGSGTIDNGDYPVWRTHFGEALMSGSGGAVEDESDPMESAITSSSSSLAAATAVAEWDSTTHSTNEQPKFLKLTATSVSDAAFSAILALDAAYIDRDADAGNWISSDNDTVDVSSIDAALQEGDSSFDAAVNLECSL